MSFTPYAIPANPGICICRTISLNLQDFACFCRTILHGSAPRRGFRHPEVNSESNIYHELKNSAIPTPPWLPLACSFLGQWLCTCNHWRPSCDWHWSCPTSILSRSNLYLVYALATWIISRTILNASRTAGHEVGFWGCPGNSRTVGKYAMHSRLFCLDGFWMMSRSTSMRIGIVVITH